MVKMDAKAFGEATLFGTAVVVLTPIVNGFIGGIGFLSTTIIPSISGASAISAGLALSAGVAATVTKLAMANLFK